MVEYQQRRTRRGDILLACNLDFWLPSRQAAQGIPPEAAFAI